MSLRNSFIALVLLSLATLGVGCVQEKDQPVKNPPLTDYWEALICVTPDPDVRDRPPTMELQMEGEVAAEFEGDWVGDGQKIARFSRNEAGDRYCSLVKTKLLDDAHVLRLDLQGAPEMQKVDVCTTYVGAHISVDAAGKQHPQCTEIPPYKERLYGVFLKPTRDEWGYPTVLMGRRTATDPPLIND